MGVDGVWSLDLHVTRGCFGASMQRSVASSTPVDESEAAFAQAHAALLRDKRLQFDPSNFEPPKPPEWLHWIGDLLQALAPLMKWAFWIGVAVVAGLILYAVGREVLRLRKPAARPRTRPPASGLVWRPDSAAAKDLLSAADLLAADGRFAEAAHLILLRSVEDIESRRPHTLRAALTTREIASLSALPAEARPAFAKIGRIVERSLFGGVPVAADEFEDCRRAYETFALPQGWTA